MDYIDLTKDDGTIVSRSDTGDEDVKSENAIEEGKGEPSNVSTERTYKQEDVSAEVRAYYNDRVELLRDDDIHVSLRRMCGNDIEVEQYVQELEATSRRLKEKVKNLAEKKKRSDKIGLKYVGKCRPVTCNDECEKGEEKIGRKDSAECKSNERGAGDSGNNENKFGEHKTEGELGVTVIAMQASESLADFESESLDLSYYVNDEMTESDK